MRRLLALALALAALLAVPGAASAATFTVIFDDDDAAQVDQPDQDAGDGRCDIDNDPGTEDCSLRAAIEEANALAGTDTIQFAANVATITPLAELPRIAGPTIVNGGGDVTIQTPAAATAPLLGFQAGSSQLNSITLRGTGAGTADRLLHVTGPGFAGASVALRNARVTGAQLAGSNGRLDSPVATNSGSRGIQITGGGVRVNSPSISGSGWAGVDVAGSNATVAGGSVHHNGGPGIFVAGQGNVLTQVILYANGSRPIELGTGANGGIQPPQDLRIGPRRTDGSLPLTGTTATGGNLELFGGDPFSATPPGFLATHSVPAGEFTYNFPSEPAPGAKIALTLTSGGTSEFALVSVPDDIVSPDVAHARAVSTTEVRVVPTEAVDPASVQASDFKLLMAGQERPIATAGIAPDGSIALTSSGWKAGEAGYVDITAPGALADPAGNPSLVAARYRVAAAPGDFIAPIATRMRLAPKSICLTRGRGCRRAGARLTFIATEAGKVEVVVQRGNKRVGTRTHVVKEGANTVDFDGRLRGRKLRAGRYRLLLYMTDIVGNRNPNPPITIFRVRRVTR